jgi:hypothetical protein
MTSDSLAAYLDGRGVAVKRHGSNAYRVSCPVHDDPSPSVDWKDGDDRILLTCRAGCDTRAVMEEWSLGLADLYFDDAKSRDRGAPAAATKPLPATAEATLRRNVDRLAADTPMLARLKRWRAWDDPDRLRSLGVGLAERGGRLTFPVRDEDGAHPRIQRLWRARRPMGKGQSGRLGEAPATPLARLRRPGLRRAGTRCRAGGRRSARGCRRRDAYRRSRPVALGRLGHDRAPA